jgi:hypothetical protein
MVFEGDDSSAFFDSDVLSDDFFIDIIERQLKISRDKFKIRLVIFTSATGKSDNYVSEVYRVKVKIERLDEGGRVEVVDVIMKASFATHEQLKKMSVFPREQLMYEDVNPSFEAIWREQANEEIIFGPRCFKAESEPYEIIVLEDLKALGYEMRDKKFGLNLLETKLALTKLAQFHAASVVRSVKDQEISPSLNKMSQVVEQPANMGIFYLYQKLLETVKKLKVSDAVVGKIVRWDLQKVMAGFFMTAAPMKCGFKVLNHGDTWLNNIMYKKDDEGNYFDALFVDFQLSYWGTPNGDLMYLLFTSVDDEVKIQHFDEILDHYYGELRRSLKRLGYEGNVPSDEEFRADLDEKKLFGELV